MRMEMLKSKLFRAAVTDANVDYEGSLGIDSALMEAVGLYPYEKILVADLSNGERFETYAMEEPAGSRRIVLNGGSALKGKVGDRVIIMSFAYIEENVVRDGRYVPRILRLNERNMPVDDDGRKLSSQQLASMNQ